MLCSSWADIEGGFQRKSFQHLMLKKQNAPGVEIFKNEKNRMVILAIGRSELVLGKVIFKDGSSNIL